MKTVLVTISTILLFQILTTWPATSSAEISCARTITADVVAIDQPIMFNRLGAQNPNGMIYALRRDVVDKDTGLAEITGGTLSPGNVELRPDKRPRPLVLRVAAGDCLTVNFQNLLAVAPNPVATPVYSAVNDQVADRYAGFHVQGLHLIGSIAADSSFVGKNVNSLVAPGDGLTYSFSAPHEGSFLVTSYGATFGGTGNNGNNGNGLFGAVNVEPPEANFYRSQVTEEALRLATVSTDSDTGLPIINYRATYPNVEPWITEGMAGLPILAMLTPTNELVYSDLNAIIVGNETRDRFPASTYPLESNGLRNPSVPNRLEPFREFTVILHDAVAAAQAFPGWFEDPVLQHTLRVTRDDSMINYAAAGVGSAVIANRLGVGPMHDCLTCAYEEFFTSAFAVGDPGILVNVPANSGLEQCGPSFTDCSMNIGPKADFALYPDDPSNVHHSYLGDFVKIRNLNAGANDSHSFHVSGHQWLANPDDDNSKVVDTQSVGPGAGFSYEIGFGGAGNRNKTVGDALLRSNDEHFARGMWSLWRIHDTFEAGTKLEASAASFSNFHAVPFDLGNGRPATDARALPDGEIIAGTPIPAVVPLPGKALAPLPGLVTVIGKDADFDGIYDSSQAEVSRETPLKNPGFPFWVAGIEDTVGQRSTTPPLDLVNDGGLPRHTLDGYRAGGSANDVLSRLDFSKKLVLARPEYYPEQGTDVEQAAMAFHALRTHSSIAVTINGLVIGDDPGEEPVFFITNGALPKPGAPFSDPCVDDRGALVKVFDPDNPSDTNEFYSSAGGLNSVGIIEFDAEQPRVYRSASIQVDAVLNKVGYHFPQQRIFSLWGDTDDFINKARAPEPLVTRVNTLDCATYMHTNLVPSAYEVDDYQVRTPTDIVGQHPSLLKHDLVASGGLASGWNYEDGSLSPGAVRQRIDAINAWQMMNQTGDALLAPEPHPFFGAGSNSEWLGARTTAQRLFADPVINVAGVERGLGAATVTDQFSPSTSQPTGLHAAVLTEPAGSAWKQSESGQLLYGREILVNDVPVPDGGPTSWQAIIDAGELANGEQFVFREFYLTYTNAQRAYETGVFVGAGGDGRPGADFAPGVNSFRSAINPPHRQSATPVFPDLFAFPALCPGNVPRPCPIAGASDADGMLSVNYRNEPVALRVYDPDAVGPDQKPGSQSAGLPGDLSFALVTQTRDDEGNAAPLNRAIPALNQQPDQSTSFDGISFPFPPLLHPAGAALPTDPYTPMLRVYQGDQVRLTVQGVGHNVTVHGVKWLQGGDSARNSGWSNAKGSGAVDQLSFSSPIDRVPKAVEGPTDYLYSVDTSEDGFWSGVWGLLRAYDEAQPGLAALATNPDPGLPRISNRQEFNGVCPANATLRTYDIVAVLANEVLPNDLGVTIVPSGVQATQHVGAPLDPNGGTLVYNPRATALENPTLSGPLHDPTAILYVDVANLVLDQAQQGSACRDNRGRLGVLKPQCKVELRPGFEVQPVVLRASAGDCVEVTLYSRLPESMPDLAGFRMLRGVVNRKDEAAGTTTFNNNLISPSSHVGLHPQLVEYDVSRHNGVNVGVNMTKMVEPITVDATGALTPGGSVTYRWYAGDIREVSDLNNSVNLVATPVEFGGVNITPSDVIKQGQKGLVGALVVMPAGSDWNEDLTGASSATATLGSGESVHDFVSIIQKGLNLRFQSGTAVGNPSSGIDDVPVPDSGTGQQGINYRSEPLWLRFSLIPESTFGVLGGVSNAHDAYSNILVDGDPSTPVFLAPGGASLRMHFLQPAGGGQLSSFVLHGHDVPNEPYVSSDISSQEFGHNLFQSYSGAQSGLGPLGHVNLLVPSAGGNGVVSGDYLFRDQASGGNFQGLWGLLRVETQIQ